MEIQGSQRYTKTNEKVAKVLETLLDPNFRIKNDSCLKLFLKRLVSKDDKTKALLQPTNKLLNEQFCQWIIHASTLWEKGAITPPATILSFALNLTGQLGCDEHIFVKLNSQNVYESLVAIAQKKSCKDADVTHGMVSMLCSFLEHKSGVQWVMAATYWIDVINLGLTAHTMYIRNKAHKFVTKLLEKTICFNRNFGVHLVGIIVRPIKDVFRSLPSNTDQEHAQIQTTEYFESLKPRLEFVAEVTSTLLKNYNSKTLQLFLEQGVPETVDQLLLLSTSEDLSFRLLKVQFVFLFYKLCVKLEGVKVVVHDSITLNDIQIMYGLIKNEMDKNNVRGVIKISDFAHGLYCSLAPHLPLCVRKEEVIEFQNQMLLFQLMPILVFSIQIYSPQVNSHNMVLNDDFRKNFVLKLLKIAAIKSLELCYKWKSNLETKLDLMEDVIFSLQYIIKAKKMLNKGRAATMFPAMVYSLIDCLTVLKTMECVEWSPSCRQFVCTLVDTIVDLVESFDLTWKDTIETIRVMDLACDFLEFPQWDDKMLEIKGLKLLNTAISKYMCPDMVLLIYSKQDSPVSKSGSLLYDKCLDSCWEVRDSALEVVYTLSLNANTRFPALTSVLLNAELPPLVVDMALEDCEYYVRTTAIRCLQELVQIPDIWDILLGVNRFLENVLYFFENETETIVRKEAVTLIYKIYRHQSFPDKLLPRLFDAMTHAAIGDLHWEVKYHAIDFWNETWKLHLTNQGMIDRIFPSHTFSKELKKIVILTETEVRKRIIKVLNQLSNCGCLYVMKFAQSNGHIEVSKKVARSHEKIIKMLKLYKISSENVDLSESSNSMPKRKDSRYQQLFEPVSPASSTTMTAPDPTDLGDPGSPQFDNYYETLSPFPSFTALPDLNQITPTHSSTSQSSSSQDTLYPPLPSQAYDPVQCQDVPLPNTPNTESDAFCFDLMTNQNTSNINPIDDGFDVEMLGCGDVNISNVTLHTEVDCSDIDSVKKDTLLNDFVGTNDLTLLQGNYAPLNQATTKSNQIKTRMYLAPSEYLEFIYKQDETEAIEKIRCLNLDELDSLLDDILKENNIVTSVSNSLVTLLD